jgi:hypothetical protein
MLALISNRLLASSAFLCNRRRRISKALRGELFSDDEIRRMETFMHGAISEANKQWGVAMATGAKPISIAAAAVVDPRTGAVVACAADSLDNPLGHAVMVWVKSAAPRTPNHTSIDVV